MTQEELSDLLLVSKFMEIQNPFPFENYDVRYAPDKDWNTLMEVCKKIIGMYYDRRSNIYIGLTNCDIDATYKAVVEFIKFWNDDTQEKLTWTNSPASAHK